MFVAPSVVWKMKCLKLFLGWASSWFQRLYWRVFAKKIHSRVAAQIVPWVVLQCKRVQAITYCCWAFLCWWWTFNRSGLLHQKLGTCLCLICSSRKRGIAQSFCNLCVCGGQRKTLPSSVFRTCSTQRSGTRASPPTLCHATASCASRCWRGDKSGPASPPRLAVCYRMGLPLPEHAFRSYPKGPREVGGSGPEIIFVGLFQTQQNHRRPYTNQLSVVFCDVSVCIQMNRLSGMFIFSGRS